MEKQDIWTSWTPARKWFLALGTLAILGLLVALWMWSHRPLTGVLFADVAERDVAVIVAELDKSKQTYALSEDGRTIYVAPDAVHKVRMELMARALPLHGVVGFEVFNNADFGANDFVQRINYLRAIQGELTRTILSIEQIQDARVHLALPEQQLFKKDAQRAKASVTLSVKSGQRLGAAQVDGIQRLVAASVAEIRPEDVAVLDQQGVLLSRTGSAEEQVAQMQLDAKQAMEKLLSQKASTLLEQMFGPGQVTVAVDVVLNHQQKNVTLEEALPSKPGTSKEAPTGIVTRERAIVREQSSAGSGSSAQGSNGGTQVTTSETEYRVGRRTEQTASTGGQIARLNVAVLVKRALGENEQVKLRQLVSAAVGLQPARGDAVAIQTLDELAAPTGNASSASAPQTRETATQKPTSAHQAVPTTSSSDNQPLIWTFLALLLIALAGTLVWIFRQRAQARATSRLSDADREVLLGQLQQWLTTPQ